MTVAESRGIFHNFHNSGKTFLVWVNEEDQTRIISMQPGDDAIEVFRRLSRAINAIESVRACVCFLGWGEPRVCCVCWLVLCACQLLLFRIWVC